MATPKWIQIFHDAQADHRVLKGIARQVGARLLDRLDEEYELGGRRRLPLGEGAALTLHGSIEVEGGEVKIRCLGTDFILEGSDVEVEVERLWPEVAARFEGEIKRRATG